MVAQLLTTPDSPAAAPASPPRRRVLFVSYHFPPVGGAGVQRPVKFVKHLRQFGWDATVLVAANPSVPVFDESLCRDLPADLVTLRARTWEPDYAVKREMARAGEAPRGLVARLKGTLRSLAKHAAGCVLQPDAQILWLPNAYRAAVSYLRQVPHDAIFATAPPYSNLLLGGLLKRQARLPLVVDFRDEWDLSSQYLENSPRDWLSRSVQPAMQRHVLRTADAVIATTGASTRRLADRAAAAGGRPLAECIYNGYDDADFAPAAPPQEHGRRFRLVYTGTLWNLTDVEPVVQAIERLHAASPSLLEALEVVVVGRKTPDQQARLDRLRQTQAALLNLDYCDHAEALQFMRSADGLCLLLSDVPGAERVVPAKLFEYLAARRPILGVVPTGETAELLRRFEPRSQFPPADVAGIARWLDDRLTRFLALGPEEPVERAGIEEFSRSHEAGQLAAVLDRVVAARI